jgi:hypothetical protein
MQSVSTHVFAGTIGLIILALAVVHLMPQASGQTGEGWVTLLDDKKMGDWDHLGETNWRLEEGVVVADNKTSESMPFWSVKSPASISICTSSAGQATTQTVVSSFAAAIPVASLTVPATR